MTDTNPPELPEAWAGAGEIWRREDDGKVWLLTPHSFRDNPPGDAVRLVPQTEVDEQRKAKNDWKAISHQDRAIIRQQKTEIAGLREEIQQLRAKLSEGDRLYVQACRANTELTAELSRLREHAIQLPEDSRAQFERTVARRTGWVTGETALIARDLAGLVESWRTATQPREENPGA